jgi:hypothetical protein
VGQPVAIFDQRKARIEIGGGERCIGNAERPALGIDGATGGSEAVSRAKEDPVLNPVQNEIVGEMQKAELRMEMDYQTKMKKTATQMGAR